MLRNSLVLALALTSIASAQLPDIGPAPGKLYDVGGRKLHLLCSGAGSPTVVFEAGASAFSIDFTLVQRELAKTTRVCAYDRAGSAWSDPAPPTPAITRDLRALLTAAGEKSPYLLVGASMGGLYVREYQADHPSEVAGLVFIDPTSDDRLFTYYEGNVVPIASLTADQYRSVIPMRDVQIRRRQPQTGTPFDRLPPDLYQLRIRLDTRLIASFPDMITYDVNIASAERERARLARLKALRTERAQPLGDLPVVVLTRGLDIGDGLEASHAMLAQMSRNRSHTVVAGSGHEVHLFAPEAVVKPVRDLVEALRAKKVSK